MDDKPALNELSALLAAELDSIGSALNSVSRAIICGIFDDAIARAEAAKVELEAEVRDLRDRVGEATEAAAEWQDAYAMNEVYGPTQLEMLRARVAGLEAALDAERAAWQWRPVTEDWPHYHDRVVIAHWGGTWAQFARRVQSDDGEDEWLLDDGRKFDFESASVALLTSPPPLPH